jgi:hypothetical protein
MRAGGRAREPANVPEAFAGAARGSLRRHLERPTRRRPAPADARRPEADLGRPRGDANRPLAAPFAVNGGTLRYEAPFDGFVDLLEWAADGKVLGATTFRGRAFGRFELSRIT